MNDTITIKHEDNQYVVGLPIAGEDLEGFGDNLPDALRDLADNFESLRESL
jgi:hypothetical protein